MNEEQEKFQHWAVVELFGHQKIAGLVMEQTIGGCSFIRVDVPAVNGAAAFTRFFGNGAIYSMTPTTEDVVRRVVEYHQPQAISIYVPSARQIPDTASAQDPGDFDDDDEDD